MTKRIFRSICLVALVVFLASVVLFMGVLYDYFSGVQKGQLSTQTELAARGVADEGIHYLEGLEINAYRITWIGTDGTVLFDSSSDVNEMENHLEREEIQQALETGYGESSRYSITLMERALYCAKRLPDGTVLRLSMSQNTLLTLTLGMMQPICIIILIAIVLSLVLASRLSKRIVEPLNRLNLDEPLNNEEYDELSPLLSRIDIQQKEIKRQHDALLHKQKEFEAVTENMAEGILLLNASGNVIGMNHAALQLFGVDSSYIGQHILSMNRSIEISKLLSEAEHGSHAETILELSGGKYQININPVTVNGERFGSVLLILNVTEKENAEQMRREFTANVSHELKTPLHTIAGSAELLENDMVKEEYLKSFYSRIHKEAQRMIRLVDDIIRLSHLDEGAADMKWETVDLYEMAEEVIKELEAEARKTNLKMELNGEHVSIVGIPRLLQSIIYNLCDNAIKYNRPDGTVTVTVDNRKEMAVLTVSDTGIGIPPEHQERIFERFYRVDKSRSKELGGTGLGLSIVKHGVKLHNGEIQVRSAENGGTSIQIMLPKDASKINGH